MRTLNLGILAHVDAGKTSLTERLLYETHVIDAIGSVDDGTTQTDTLDLERRRGITIKAAVVSFVVDDVTVNLIDTPGHPDFIAEVERVLTVLDGAVLVISAVEGVQAQTRVLLRTLQRLHIPTLLFVNKIDRRGADIDRVMETISAKLTPAVVAMGSVSASGTRDAGFEPHDATDPIFCARLCELLADHDDAVLAAYVGDSTRVPYGTLRTALATHTRRARVHPLFFGSAITGAGVQPLIAALTELLPAANGDVEAPLSGTIFKVELGSIRLAFHKAVEDTVAATLQQGLYGWNVTDCVVTMTHSGYAPRQSHSHARFDKSMSSTGADFRHLTPLVLMSALKRAGTQVCEPVQQFRIEFPADVLSAVSHALAQLDAIPLTTQAQRRTCTIEGEIPAARVHAIQQQPPSLSRGEGVFECSFAGYRPVRGKPPTRSRTDFDPLNRRAYLLRVMRRVK